jgi:hypothetical protein
VCLRPARCMVVNLRVYLPISLTHVLGHLDLRACVRILFMTCFLRYVLVVKMYPLTLESSF